MNLRDKIKELAERVHKELGVGYNESVYELALAVELRNEGIPYQMEVYTEVFYKDWRVGAVEIDFLVGQGEETILVELKALQSLGKSSVQQIKAYLRTHDCKVGMVINFSETVNIEDVAG